MSSGSEASRPQIETFTIPQIVDLAARGRLRLPDVARPFVWGAAQVRQFFDSLYRGVPVGALLFMEHAAPATTVRFGPIEIDAPRVDRAFSVIDGHQRIAALVAALTPHAGGTDDTFDLYLALPEERFIQPDGGFVLPGAIPVREAFSTRSLLGWWREHVDDLGDEAEAATDRLVRALREYRIPAYVLDPGNARQQEEVFVRINGAGTSLRRADLFRAAFADDDIGGNLAGMARALSTRAFGALDEDVLVDSLLAVRGGDVRRHVGDEFASGEDRGGWLDETRMALGRAIDFLVTQGVPHVRLMPTASVFPVLAAFFHLHPDPSPWNRRLLARWLWRSWARLALGRSDRMREYEETVPHLAVRRVIPHKLGHDEAPDEYAAAAALMATVPGSSASAFGLPVSASRLQMRTVNGRVGRLAFLTLVAAGPLGPDGVPIDVADAMERSGLAAASPLLPGGTLATRSFWPRDAVPLADVPSAAIRESHLLVDDAARFLRENDVGALGVVRAWSLATAIDDLLANRMEIGASVRPPIADLVDPPESA